MSSGAASGGVSGAVAGAAIGTMFAPGMGTAIGAAAGGGLGMLGGMMGDEAADLQGQAARAQLEQQRYDRALATQYAMPSEMEMQQLQEAITLNSQDVARKQKLLDSSDPALIEAGKQALELMQGKQAAAVAPIQRQRDMQRKKLEATLAQRLGTDYAQSSAGIQALNDFDKQTGDLMTGAQQQTLGQFLGVAQNMQGFGSTAGNTQMNLGIANQRGSINSRMANAITGNRIDPGLQYAGDLASARNRQQMFGSMLNAGTSLGMMYAMGGGGGGAASGGGGGMATGAPVATTGGSYTNYGAMA